VEIRLRGSRPERLLAHLRPPDQAQTPMVQRNSNTGGKPQVDRRTGHDRRQADQGLPRGRERRVGIEPRKPEVVELQITPSDWVALRDAMPPDRKKKA
jgi:hypothetical protein